MSSYAPGQDRPLASYAAMTATFGAALGTALVALRKSGRELPERPTAGDLVLGGIATHKVSRLIAKDRVTSFIRAPFTRYQEAAGHGELEEAPRGTGMQLALGELLVCPYCLAQWVAAGFAVGAVAAPRTTRFVAGIYVAETISDVLQLAYKAAEDRA
ncbi:MAG: DUF1360 domain-containing protein [Solirubrobacteraceae bacterium]